MHKYDPNIHHRRSIRLKGYDYSKSGAYFITICCDQKTNRFGKIVGSVLAPDLHNDTDIRSGASPDPTPNNTNNNIPTTNPQMILNEFGKIAYDEWVNLTNRFPNLELDVFQIMPNHMHGIIIIKNNVVVVGSGLAPDPNNNNNESNINNDPNNNNFRSGLAPDPNNNNNESNNNNFRSGASPNTTSPTISDIIGAYKSLVANECLKLHQSKFETTNIEPTYFGKLWQRNFYEHIIRDEKSYQNISNYIINNPKKWFEDRFYNK